jgi:hypothetical protein
MKPKKRFGESTVQRFIGCLSGMNQWATIDEFVDALDEGDFWDEAFYSKVEAHAKKQFTRRMLRKAKDETNWPIWANVKMQDAKTGVEARVYKQESLFDVSDYVQVCSYHHQRGLHHLDTAKGYKERAERRFGKQIAFAFGNNAA